MADVDDKLSTAPEPAAPGGDDYGLSAEERAIYEGNRNAPNEPAAPEPAVASPDPAAAAAATATPSDPAAAAQGGVPGPEDGEEDDDDVTPPSIDPKTGKLFRKRVNYMKWQRAVERAKTAEGKITELSANIARMDERLKIFTDVLQETPAQQQAAAAADPKPDPKEDIFAYIEWQDREIARIGGKLNDRETKDAQSTERQNAEREFSTAYVADSKRFQAQQPDFPQAYRHLIGVREIQLAELGYDENQIVEIVQREERALALQAYKSGKNPAERLYAVAKTFGYTPPAAAATPTPAPAPAANGGALAPAANGAVVPPRVDVAAQINGVKAALPAGQSLSGGAGAAPPVMDMAYLESLPPHEFSRIYESLSPEQRRAVMGGA